MEMEFFFYLLESQFCIILLRKVDNDFKVE